jgi:hypothetical protein
MIRLIARYIGLIAVAFIVTVTSAHAQAYVSATGSDSNTCTQASPCATFQRAYAVSPIIQCLNSGTFSTTTLTLTGGAIIDCGNGNTGFMYLSSGAAININASSSAIIYLRNLSISGALGSTTNGVVTTNLPGGALIIWDSTIAAFGGDGTLFTPNTGSPGGRASLELQNIGAEYNNVGVSVSPASGQIASVSVINSTIGNNANDGLDLAGVGVVAGDLRQSVVQANGVNGITASSAGGVYFTVEGSTITDNLGVGIETNSAAVDVEVATSTIGGNGTGVKAISGSLISFGNNQISANGSNGSFTSTIPLQ